MSDNADQYLTFTLGDEVYAFDIASVREVLEYTSITKVPRMSEYVRGIINLRGRAVPVMDLRLKFGLPETVRTVSTCIIIVEVALDEERTVLGALTDSVREVMHIGRETIEPAPRMGTSIAAEYIRGIARDADGFILILDIGRIFSQEELAATTSLSGEEGSVTEAA